MALVARSVDTESTITYLLLRLGEEFYALPGAAVREVIRYRPAVPIPGTPPSLPGLLNQRGVVLTVTDLRPLLGLDAAAPGRASRYVYIQHAGVDLALIADDVIDLVEIAPDQHEPLPTNLDPLRAKLLQALVQSDQRLVALLNLDTVLGALRDEP